MEESSNNPRHEPWNKGKLVGQKAPLKLKDIQECRYAPRAARNLPPVIKLLCKPKLLFKDQAGKPLNSPLF